MGSNGIKVVHELHPCWFEAFLLFRGIEHKGGFTTAGRFGHGIVELQTTVHQAITPVDNRIFDIEVAFLINEDAEALGFKLEVEPGLA